MFLSDSGGRNSFALLQVDFDGSVLAECTSSPDEVQYATLSLTAIRSAFQICNDRYLPAATPMVTFPMHFIRLFLGQVRAVSL